MQVLTTLNLIKMKNFYALCFILLLISCGEGGSSKKYVPDSAGGINSLSVIIEDDLWKGEVGDVIRKHFAANVTGLPWDEPLFSIHQMRGAAFSGFYRTSRNVLIVRKDSVASAGIRDGLYAKPQKVVFVKAPDTAKIISMLNDKASEFIKELKQHEIEENQKRMRLSLNKETKLKEKLGISLSMSSVYKIVREESNFFWIEKQIQKGNMNILAYEMPLNSIPNDSTRVDAIIKMRDSIGERYIQGRKEGMYMITEKALAPFVFEAKIAGKNAIETRGMWEMKNFMMAGPYLNYIIEDKKNNRLLVIEGFTFAPSTNKRDFMFELEAILKSLKIES